MFCWQRVEFYKISTGCIDVPRSSPFSRVATSRSTVPRDPVTRFLPFSVETAFSATRPAEQSRTAGNSSEHTRRLKENPGQVVSSEQISAAASHKQTALQRKVVGEKIHAFGSRQDMSIWAWTGLGLRLAPHSFNPPRSDPCPTQ